MTLTAALDELDDLIGIAEPAAASVRNAQEIVEDLDATYGADPDFAAAKVEAEIARYHAFVGLHYTRRAHESLTNVGVAELQIDTVHLPINVGTITLDSITGAGPVGVIEDTTGAPIDGSTRSTAFSVEFTPTDANPDRVKWFIDGKLYRDDDLGAPYELRYNGDPILIRSSFAGESAPAGQESPNEFFLTTGDHTITAVYVLGTVETAVTVTFTIPEIVIVPGGDLLWTPPGKSNGYGGFEIVTLGGGGPTTIRDKPKVLVDMQAVRSGSLQFENCGDVVVVGGEIYVGSDNGYDNGNMAVRFKNCYGTAHIEGVKGGGPHLVEGFHGQNASSFVLQIQNCFIDWIHGSKTGLNHSDLVGIWGGLGGVRIYNFTGRSHYQGLMMKADFQNPIPDWDVRRFNCYAAEGTPIDTQVSGGRFMFWNSGRIGGTYFEPGTVWCDWNSDHSDTVAGTVWNNNNPNGPYTGAAVGDATTSSQYTELRGDESYVDANGNPSSIAPRVYGGVPAGGDYCPESVPGLGYISPDGN